MTRIAVVERQKCNPAECGDFVCMRFCPVNRMAQDCIIKSADGKINIDEGLCTGCGICTKKCPFEAIHIINLPEKLTSKPIHQYGKNGFLLYSLPMPIFGKVVGIIGKNGIGKSTAIKIIAGVLKPNMGGKEEAGVDDLIKFFKGTEAQAFFEGLKAGKIKIAYKPQAVDLIPKQAKGKVKDLLKKADEKGMLKEIMKELEIEKIADNDISEISGGELQRVAIAATVLKKANLYIFDEPTSYLDIKQRLKISQFIRNLADDETGVLVVEHDLIVLDYIADLIHLMYGEESCYGIVSFPKTARVGINIYLSGYLKEENVRFRGNEIKFAEKPPVKDSKSPALVSWEGLHKKLGHFELTAKEGHVTRKTVVGILGENGTGKTSFVKILAGVLKTDKGELTKNVKVAYKPQYLNTESDELVAHLLKDYLVKHETDVIRPLNIKPLLAKKLNELSGGELQRVMIALCLCQDVDLYLMDEPSAYLDVEQRLITSKVIRERMELSGKTALVVDHDLLFVDYLSQNLLVFTGEPAVKGIVNGQFSMEKGMNFFLEGMNITLRRDPESKRPRVNKPESQMDQKQKREGKLYYA